MAEEHLENTPLAALHHAHGAKMGAFAGYSMPLFYPLGLIREHLHTREKAGLFDICHMVHIEISGAQAAEFVSRLCPFSASEQEIGSCRYTFFLNGQAGIIDDLIVTRLAHTRFLIVANAGCADKDIAHVKANSGDFEVNVEVLPRGFLALQGPKAEAALKHAGIDVSSLSFMTAMETENGYFISRTGYTGEDGFEIALSITETESFAQKLLSHDDVELIGLGARDSLRLEAGLSLYGQDLDETITPHEAGLVWAIPKSLRNGGSFIGSDALAAKIQEGRSRKRVGLKPKQKIPVRAGASLSDASGNEIGKVTSGGFGPSLEYPVALGLIASDAGENGIIAEVRGKQIEMEIARLPFVEHRYKR